MDFYFKIGLSFLLLIFGFALLIKGANWFVDGNVGIANKLGISKLVIALTIVAMGTSIPETSVSLMATFQKSNDLAIGNIIGSNTLNILFILGISAILSPLFIQRSTIYFEIPMLIVISIIFAFIGLGSTLLNPYSATEGTINRIEGIILLGLFILYIIYIASLAKKSKRKEELPIIEKSISWKTLIFSIIFGLIFVIIGSNLTVKSAISIAKTIGISERFIGLTIVALGTSLPELVTSITAAIKNQDDVAVGNIIGSNIYNMLFIGGLASIIKPLPYNASFTYDSFICIGAVLILFSCILINPNNKLNRASGIVLFSCYIGYFFWLL